MSSSTTISDQVVSAAVNEYLNGCTQAELNAIVEAINVISKKNSVRNMPHGQPKVKKTKRVAQGTSAKRPLNSWMAFRTYYSPIFTSQQQKDISSLMTLLWRSDPYHAEWTILAKAYSIIRDYKGMMKPELEAFLSICCPQIGMVSPQQYLILLGWNFTTVGGVKTLTRISMPDVTAMKVTPAVSVENVITLCFQVGFVNTDDMDMLGGRSSLTMTAPTVSAMNDAPGSSELTALNLSSSISTNTSVNANILANQAHQSGFTPVVNGTGSSSSFQSTDSILYDSNLYFDDNIRVSDYASTDMYEPQGGDNFAGFCLGQYDTSQYDPDFLNSFDAFEEDFSANFAFNENNETDNAHWL